ncbi:sugar transporter [Colletotrichum scovillei]|uniref:Sugar transporter n=1 Tax=Colletotrichum scovillei TaxID=1209932 RepID=A0A9P7UL57_9PEZI|nr:sugar transporter [Colletotrichum scovillei]KAF4785249.1 sugar transporter [Colletotrichum scovillei]KAG7054910.1 sugar transporter [Colletotrichum scovillei]KAG7074292.1 sugar transporter [Colletotrichum scovillei]KAG7081086.1 sugar transporter [Colletotrichum scovillei]
MGIKSVTQHFNKRLFASVFLIAVSQFNYGFDNQAFTSTQAMDAFERQFGEYDDATRQWKIPTYFLSLLNSLNYIGFAAGLVIGSLTSARFGRRTTMIVMSVYALISATVVVTSTTKEQILVGRILNYVYVGFELAVVPVYQSEIVPAPVRGMVVGTYQLSIGLGGLVINSICRGTSSFQDSRAYRIPFGLFYVIPSIVLALIWFIPESPRWLLLRDRVEEARKAHHLLREGTMSEDDISNEFAKIQQSLLDEPEQGRTKELFQGVNRKRTAIAVGMSFFQQATGQAFASQYGAVWVKSLGTLNPFDVTLGSSALTTGLIITCLFLTDRVGRRKILLVGAAVQTVALYTMAGLGVPRPVPNANKSGMVGMLLLFGAGFGLGWGPLTYVVVTEVPALRLRDRSQRVSSLVNIFMNFLVNFTLPYLLNAPYAALQSKVGFIFGSIAVCSALFVFFCVPECKGRSLEEIDRMFHDGVPVRHFGDHPRSEVEINTSKVVDEEEVFDRQHAPEEVK